MNSDNDLIKDCLLGKQLAYKELYNKYISYCYGICIRYSVNKSEIKDVVQIIFTQVFQSLKNFDSEKASFKTWLTRVCINQILSQRRKQSRQFQTQNFENLEESFTHNTENFAESTMEQQHMLSIIKQMPENYQVVFNLFIIDGYSHKEIAEQLSITSESSRVLLNRARGWVKKKFVAHLNS